MKGIQYVAHDIPELIFCLEENITYKSRREVYNIIQYLLCGNEFALRKRDRKLRRKVCNRTRRMMAIFTTAPAKKYSNNTKPNQRRRGIG
ncbi:hypothetical protein NVP2275O_164 [Vibrio phage 2.275.O._10N.286.54.E11]|nr:hypothetical protein NVP2275O_164 [Vibrio phage 2.275.O._10N.286.54.E11]